MRLHLLILIFFLNHSPAYAYLDPGTGAIIIQAIIGAFAAIVVYWSKFKQYIKTLFKKKDINDNDINNDKVKK